MKKLPTIDNWGTFRHDGIIYFAQRVNEMLFHYSEHLYKKPLLNTHLLVKEYLKTEVMVRKGIVFEKYLSYIKEELIESIGSDTVLKKHIDPSLRDDYVSILRDENKDKNYKFIRYFSDILRHYPDWVLEDITAVVLDDNGKRKRDIESVLRCFVPEVIGMGYSHEYVYQYNHKIFFEEPVDSTDCFNEFLERFNCSYKSYTVYVSLPQRFKNFSTIIERAQFSIVESEESEEINKSLTKNPRMFVIKRQVDALDEYGANRHVSSQLHYLFDFDYFISNNKQWYFKWSYVKDELSGNISYCQIFTGLSIPKTFISNDSAKIEESLINIGHNSDRNRIGRAIKLHNDSIAEFNTRNGYLNLWSILEILFVTKDTDKLDEITNAVIPIIVIDYLVEQFYILEEYLKKAVADKLNEIRDSINSKYWFYEFVILDDYAQFRKDVFGLLVDYPLIRFRLMRLHEHFGKKEHIKSECERMHRRLNWHLARIYKTRNSLIHSGESIEYIKELGEHLHSYVDKCIFQMTTLSAHYTSIEAIMTHTDFSFKELKNLLLVNGSMSKDDIAKFVSYTSYSYGLDNI